MTARRVTFCVVLIGALLVPASGSSQVFGGAYGAWAQDSFDGTYGLGAMLGFDFPLFPVDVFGSGEWFNPDCDGCSLNGWALGANLRLPLPLIRPYLTGGWVWRDAKGDVGAADPFALGGYDGAFGGIGVDVALAGIRLFVEGRYEYLKDDLKQVTARGGVLIR